MRVMLTGGTGTVGLAVAEHLLAHGLEVVVFASTPAPDGVLRDLQRVSPSIEFVTGDVRDRDRLLEVMRDRAVDSVVHGAAITPDTAREMARPWQVLDVNCVGSATVVEAFTSACSGRFVHLSSIAAYGSATSRLPLLREEAGQEAPVNLYEISKLAGEQSVLRVAELLGREAVSLRLGDVFGRWERASSDRDATSAPFQTLELAKSGQRALLPRTGRKAWVYTVDVAHAVLQALTVETLPDRVINVSSPFTWSMEEWCELLREEFPEFDYEIDPVAANVFLFDDNAPMDLTRSQRIGFNARYDLPTAFRDYVDWGGAHTAP